MTDSNSVISRFSGFASEYNKCRPTIPKECILFIRNLLKTEPSVVVDLGSGTGESTLPWVDIAESVIGVEPSPDMYNFANENKPNKVTYLNRYAHDTGLKSESADIITCSASLHWMEPVSLSKEIDRILKPQGIFCSYGHYYPFFNESWELTKCFEEWRLEGINDSKINPQKYVKQYNVEKTMRFFEEIDLLQYLRKIHMHSLLKWSFEDFKCFIDLYPDLINQKKDQLSILAKKEFADQQMDVLFAYTIWVGIKT
jgi:ubiquinone/menaquinone biosynthesis C-methylase UbiE